MASEAHNGNPYVGPRPFYLADRVRFFGRDREAGELLSLVVAHRGLLLYAQSGAGKTSLINAGLIPLLEREGFEALPLARVQGRIPDAIQPAQVPNPYTLNTLISWAEEKAGPEALLNLSLADFLEGRPRLKDGLGMALPRVVIFDQFEELFSFYQERWPDREDFFRQVQDALEADPLLRVVLVVREDYIAQLDPYAAFLPEKLRIRFRLERLREPAALDAVKGPLVARGSGRHFAAGVAEDLVQDLMKVQVVTATGNTETVPGEFVEPVQLQVTCRNLWAKLRPGDAIITQKHVEAFGDVNQALAGFYEQSLRQAAGKAGLKEADLRAWFERHLITSARTRGTVYREREQTGEIPNMAVDALEDVHLITGEWRAGARWYELTHDRFIEPIRRSNRRWREKESEEQARKRRRGLAAAGVTLATMVVVLSFALLSARTDQTTAQATATAGVAMAEKAQATATAEAMAAQRAQATAVAVAATATSAFDPKSQATVASNELQVAQATATAAATQLNVAPSSPGPTSIGAIGEAAIGTAAAAAQSLQIAEQKATAAAGELAATATPAAVATAIADSRQRIETAGLTGRGVKIAIVDTGIDPDHPDFAGRIVAGMGFLGDENNYRDDNGHGTFVASIVAGSGAASGGLYGGWAPEAIAKVLDEVASIVAGSGAASGGLYRGWAPEAKLYIAKVLDEHGRGSPSNVVAGINWAIDQKVDILLIALGTDCVSYDLLSQKADAAVEAGLVVVVPVGNSGPESGTVASPGCARLPITVGAATTSNEVASFSSRGPTFDGRTKPDLVFYGSSVGAQASGTQLGSVIRPRYIEFTDTTADVAGAIALLLQKDPGLTPAEVKELLKTTAIDLDADPNAQGAGLMNIEAALARLKTP
jgi:subtilisin family serine protease